jgi:hypothetical protein
MPKAKSKKREKSQMEIVTTKPQNSKGPLKGKTSRKRAKPDIKFRTATRSPCHHGYRIV